MQGRAEATSKSQWLSLVVIGAGIGWLVANSASPVLGGVLTSLLGIAAGGLAALKAAHGNGGTPHEPRLSFDARPLALLVAGLALAATAGLYVRSHALLEPPEVRDALRRAAAGGALETSFSDPTARARLFGISTTECQQLLSLGNSPEGLADQFRRSSIPGAERLADSIDDPTILLKIVEAQCERS